MTISAHELREILDYSPATGELCWRVACKWKRYAVGDVAGSLNGKGHIKIQIKRRSYFAHRLAWLHVHGRWPDNLVDHINGDGTDNRLCNLRDATHSQSQWNKGRSRNNTTGAKGVSRRTDRCGWMATITVGRKKKYLGTFGSITEAGDAYAAAARSIFGEFART